MFCSNCGEKIPEKRIDLGYSTCVNCSTEKRWTGHSVIYHKTGNTIDIIKDEETAIHLAKLSSRNGFSSARKTISSSSNKSVSQKRIPAESTGQFTKIKAKSPPDPSKWKDTENAENFFNFIENNQKDQALSFLNKKFQDGEISPSCRKKLLLFYENETKTRNI
jgi:hypothetical protein